MASLGHNELTQHYMQQDSKKLIVSVMKQDCIVNIGMFSGDVVLYNVFYEVFTVCTSIVAQDPSGRDPQLYAVYNETLTL